MNFTYCESLTEYKRFKTREVKIGDIALGGDNPIRIQSMTTTDTMDTIGTVEQTIRMIESGCEYVRITAPSIKEAHNLANIKKELKNRGYSIPLIADIHFTPNAAEVAARIVEKVRINPGNFIDKKKFQVLDYTELEYKFELERIRERFVPLIKICKEYGTAIRIGANHGSLSDRILSRYGDNPLGMVESAMEFLRICEDESFYNIVLSMKASNTRVMVQAYRLLVNKMIAEEMNYPLHLGVTEAGDGEDGRVKSAVGIGTLLEDGLGDTVRVSLTEPPEFEAPVARELINRYSTRKGHDDIEIYFNNINNPFEYSKRNSETLAAVGGQNLPKVIVDLSNVELSYDTLKEIGYIYDEVTDKWTLTDFAADIIYLGKNRLPFSEPAGLKILVDYDYFINNELSPAYIPHLNIRQFFAEDKHIFFYSFLTLNIHDLSEELLNKLKHEGNTVLILESSNSHAYAELRRAIYKITESDIHLPIIIKREYKSLSKDALMLHSATDFGALLNDGFGDGIWLNSSLTGDITLDSINKLMFNILQAARVRVSKTEYIACPSCGRTLFDLLETTDLIRRRTAHLKGLKIAVMGCIVNGPGEMADADYGYVGSGPGKITLYKGKEVVRRNIESENAVDELIQLIKDNGNWVDPK